MFTLGVSQNGDGDKAVSDPRTRDFLTRLWRGGSHAYFWLSEEGVRGGQSQWLELNGEWSRVEPWTVPADRDSHVYFGVNPTGGIPYRENGDGRPKPSESVRASNEDVVAVNALYAELDVGKGFGSKEQILAYLETTLRPSVVVDSGGGYHAYWLLDQPYLIHDEDDRRFVDALQKKHIAQVGGDPGAKDLARVMRLPGSLNLKAKYGGGYEVSFVWCDLEQVHPLEALVEFVGGVEVEPEPEQVAETPALDNAQILARLALARRSKGGEAFSALYDEGDLSAYGGDQSAADFGLMSRLVFWLGKNPETLEEAFSRSALGQREKWQSRGDYRQRTIANAVAKTPEVYTEPLPRPETALALATPTAAEGEVMDAFSEFPLLTGAEDSDVGMAHSFCNSYGERIRHNSSLGWLAYEGGVWLTDAEHKARILAQEDARRFYYLAGDTGKPQFADMAKRRLESGRISAALREAKPWLSVDIAELDAHPTFLNAKNGVVDLTTGRLMPHSPELLLTQQASVEFDPQAACPKWMAFLEMILEGDEHLIRYLQAALGWAVSGRSDVKALFFLYGPGGDNGKTTLVETIFRLLGNYSLKTNLAALMSSQAGAGLLSPYLAEFRGKRLVVANETEEGMSWNETALKDLTGGDKLKANPKYKDPFEFYPTHTLLVYGNDKPQAKNAGGPFWNRMKPLPFNYSIPKSEQRDQATVIAEFLEEGPGILNWLIEGYKMAASGWITKHEPDGVSKEARQYRSENDSVENWLEECCERDPSAEELAVDLYQSFSGWATAEGESRENQRWLTGRLTARGFTRGGKGRKKIKGLRLIPHDIVREGRLG